MAEGPRAKLHRGESASWNDGEGRGFGCDAGLGVRPAQVCLPPESEWTAIAPRWATELRARVVRDFEAIGARVVDVPGARVHWHDALHPMNGASNVPS
jgi:hypothetical protein